MKLIVNADDFGFSKEVNSNIIKCHRQGIVTSATILAGSEQFDEAIELAKQNPNLGIGVHLAIDGPNNIGKEYSSLLDPKTGNFYEDLVAVKKITRGHFLHKELVAEYSLQIEKLLETGLTVTHLDHHHHLHLYFTVLFAMIEVAKKYNIPYIRPQRLIYLQKSSYFKRVYRYVHHYYLQNRYNTIDGYTNLIGLNKTGKRKKFERILSSNESVIELVVHPLEKNGEIDFLIDPETIKAAQNYLINYGDLEKSV